MQRTGKVLGVVGVVVALLAASLWFIRTNFSPAARLAKLPASEQNRAIYDAAIELLKSNYYDPALFEKPDWAEFEARWRQKSIEYPGRGVWFYMNVLQNFSASFPESHLYFQAPASAMVPPPGLENRKPAEPKPKPVKTSASQPPIDPADAGPGFESATIRRGAYLRNVVTEVTRGTPAERAGISPGWLVGDWGFTANDTGMHYKATFFKLTPANTRELERSGLPLATTSQPELDEFVKTHTLQLAFDYERVPPHTNFDTHPLPNGATYLRFDSFDDWGVVSRAIDAIDAAGPKGLVLDLRRNTGGLMLHMIRVNGRLLGGDVDLGTLRGRESNEPLTSLKLGDGHYEGPLVVLIGPATASAAEITAAAVQHHARGKLIGRTTNGSVITAQKYTLPDGGLMTIPTKDFVRPDQRRIEAIGVEPDIWILPTLDDVRAARDPVLERAIQELQR